RSLRDWSSDVCSSDLYAVRRAARARARTLLTLGCCTGERDVRFRAALQLQPRHAMRVEAETHSFGQPTGPPYKWRRRLALRRRRSEERRVGKECRTGK